MNVTLTIYNPLGTLQTTLTNVDSVVSFEWTLKPAPTARTAGGCVEGTLELTERLSVNARDIIAVDLDGERVFRGMLTTPPQESTTLGNYVYELVGEAQRLGEITMPSKIRYTANTSLQTIVNDVMAEVTPRSSLTADTSTLDSVQFDPELLVIPRGSTAIDALDAALDFTAPSTFYSADANGVVYFMEGGGDIAALTIGTHCDWQSEPTEDAETLVNVVRGVRGDKYTQDATDAISIANVGEIHARVDIPEFLGSRAKINDYLTNQLFNLNQTPVEGTLDLYSNAFTRPSAAVSVTDDGTTSAYEVFEATYSVSVEGIQTRYKVGRAALSIALQDRKRRQEARRQRERVDSLEDKIDKLGDVRRINPDTPLDADGFTSLDAYKSCDTRLMNDDSRLFDRTELHKLDSVEERKLWRQRQKALRRDSNLPSTDASAYNTLVPDSCVRTFDGKDDTFPSGQFDPATYDGLDEIARDMFRRDRHHTIELDDLWGAIPTSGVGLQPAGNPANSIDPEGTQKRNDFNDWLHERLDNAGGNNTLTIPYTLTATPQPLSATPCPDGNDVEIAWAEPTTAPWNWDYTAVTRFDLRYKKDNGTDYTEILNINNTISDPETQMLTGLELGQTYVAELKIYYEQTRNEDTDDDGIEDTVTTREYDTGWSESVTFTTLDDSAKSAPSGVASEVIPRGARLTWDAPAGTDTYVDTSVTVTHTNGTEDFTGLTTPADLDLNPHNGDYVEGDAYTVKLTHNYNTGASCDVTTSVTAGAPEYPAPVASIIANATGLELTVTAPTPESILTWQGVKVEVWNGTAYADLGTSTNATQTFTLDNPPYTRDVARNMRLTNLYTDTRFSVADIASDEVLEQVTIPDFAKAPPANFVLSADETDIVAAWDNPTDPDLTFTGVELDILDGTWQNVYAGTLETATLNIADIAGLERDTDYNFRLRAVYEDATPTTINSDYVTGTAAFTPIAFSQPQNIVSESNTAGFVAAWEAPPVDTAFRTFVRSDVEAFNGTWNALSNVTSTEVTVVLDDSYPLDEFIPIRVRHVYTDVALAATVESEWTDSRVKKLGVPAPTSLSFGAVDHGFMFNFSTPSLPTGVTYTGSTLERYNGTAFVAFQTTPFALDSLTFTDLAGQFERAEDVRFRLRHNYERDSDSAVLESEWREFVTAIGKVRPPLENFAALNDETGVKVSWDNARLLDNTTYTETQVEINDGTTWQSLGAFTSSPQTIALNWNTYTRGAEYLVRARHVKSYNGNSINTEWVTAPARVGRDRLNLSYIITRDGTYTHPVTGDYAIAASNPVRLTGNGTLEISESTTGGVTTVTLTVSAVGTTASASSTSPYASAQSDVSFLGVEVGLE